MKASNENKKITLDLMGALNFSHDGKNALGQAVLAHGLACELTTDPEVWASLNKAIIATERLIRLFKQYDGWIMSESPRVSSGCDTTELITKTLNDFAVSLPPAVKLVRKIGGHLLPTAMEPVEIESVMVNLLDNALYALMPAGGTIEVIAHNVLLDRAIPGVLDTVIPAGHWVAVSVVDNGPGIAFEVAKRLFVPYNTSKPLGKGTGLGLATIKHILVSNGGGIRFRSVPANGACFRFYLPVLSKDLPKQSS